jgi:hypothetical protein
MNNFSTWGSDEAFHSYRKLSAKSKKINGFLDKSTKKIHKCFREETIKAGGIPCDGKELFKWTPFSRTWKSYGKFCRPR